MGLPQTILEETSHQPDQIGERTSHLTFERNSLLDLVIDIAAQVLLELVANNFRMRMEYIQAEDHREAHHPRDQNPLHIFSLKVTGDVMEPSLSSMLNQMIHVRSAVQKMKLPTSDSLQNTGMTKSKEMLKTTLQI